jgi:hypothetical protein
MSEEKHNPAAFPSSYGDPRNSGWIGGGMTLRDWFAGKALAAYIEEGSDCTVAEIAADSYRLADAMLEARKASQ